MYFTTTHLRRPIRMLVQRVTMLPPCLLLVLLLAAAWRAEAQPSSPPSGEYSPGNYSIRMNPTIASLLIAFICGFFFLGFFSVYLRRCAEHSAVAAAARGDAVFESEGNSGCRRRNGLDRAVLETFPTMAYAKAKEMGSGKEAMECAVCLSEFSDDDVLRLLPRCCHVFHVDCVDVWLESHVTCPVCRANLLNPAVPAADGRATVDETGDDNSTEEVEDAGIRHGVEDLEAGLQREPAPAATVRRSHSTGHEAAGGAPEDRYTLRLPEHVRREILEAGRLRRAASLRVSSGGEASGRRGHSGGAGAGRSGRWGFLLRTFSVTQRTEIAPVPARSPSSKRIFPSVGTSTSVSVGDGDVDCKYGSDKKDEGKSSSDPVEERV